MQSNSIKNWSEDDRPREKMLIKGCDALSNAELLAILINNGTRNKSAVDLAKELMSLVNNDLQRLGKLTVKEIVNLKVKGLGEAKAVAIAAALEIGIRRSVADFKQPIVTSSKQVANYLKALLQFKNHEVFIALFLNASSTILHNELISEGGIAGTVVDTRILVKKALEYNAVKIILCHNHPGGGLEPSKSDIALTTKIKTAAALFDIVVNDHIIVSSNGYYSFADNNLM